ncbi:MAG TPA: WYL domain-containing protein [Caldimonas sp.]|nr:WYL domain-containing protein [Caldimonas sp.]
MPRRPDNLETVRLAIELLRRIPRQSKVSAQDLHAQLSAAGIVRSERTIQRQLDMLSEHFDIEREDKNKPYGYRWKEGAAGFSLPSMTEKEALLLTLAEQHLRNLLPSSVLNSMKGFFAQARRSLGPDQNAQLERQWLSKVRIVSTTQPLLPPPIREGVLEEVGNALFGNRWLHVDYENAAGKRWSGDVMPLGLAQQGPSLYLVVRYRDLEGERNLALHRIHSATASTLRFKRPEFELKAFDDEGQFGLGSGVRIKIGFDIEKDAGRHLLEARLSLDQRVEELEDHYRITATVTESEWLWRWIRAFGKAVCAVKVNGRAVDPAAPQRRRRAPK